MYTHDSAFLSASFWYWIAWFSFLVVVMGNDLRKAGDLPVSHDDYTILKTCDAEVLQKLSLQQESAVAGAKPLENEELLPIWRHQSSRNTQNSQFSSSHFPFPEYSADHPSPSSVLWEDEVQWLKVSLVARQLKAKWDVDTRMFLLTLL